MKNFKVKFSILFNKKEVKEFTTTVPADTEEQAFDKADRYINAKMDSVINSITEVQVETKRSEHDMQNKLDRISELLETEDGFDNLNKEQFEDVLSAFEDMTYFLNIAKRMKFGN